MLTFANSLIILFAYAQSPTELYTSANAAYKAGQYDQAASGYEKVLTHGYKSPEVYYNLGNCYYKLNNLGKAILNYERAQNLAPDDEDIQHNLKLANLLTIDKIQPVPQLGLVKGWNNFVCSQSSKGWGMFSVIFIWLSLLAFAIYLFMGSRRIFSTLGILLLLLSVGAFFLAVEQTSTERNPDSAILMVTNAFVKSAPDANGNDLFMIHEGVKLRLLDQVGSWEKIRLADGKVGWVEKSTFEKI